MSGHYQLWGEVKLIPWNRLRYEISRGAVVNEKDEKR